MLILPALRVLVESALGRHPDASDDPEDIADAEPCEVGDHEACARDREAGGSLLLRPDAEIGLLPTPTVLPTIPIVDLEQVCATVRYERGSLAGKVKRTLYPRVKLAARRVVVMVHQAGVERPELAKDGKSPHPRRKQMTGHRAIGPRGYRYRLHPLDVRLIAGNRMDRDPWHALHIELVGNFEGVDGSGRWSHGLTNGRGRASDAQLLALQAEIAALVDEVPRVAAGARVVAVIPHRITGRDAKGRPNREIDPGSRTWVAAEEAAHALELLTPAPGWALGGLPVPDEWRPNGPPACARLRG